MSGEQVAVERVTVGDILGRDIQVWAADVTLADGTSLGLSQRDGETYWACDSMISPNGAPVFVHGVGSRYCLKRVAGDDLAAQLDAARDELDTFCPRAVAPGREI